MNSWIGAVDRRSGAAGQRCRAAGQWSDTSGGRCGASVQHDTTDRRGGAANRHCGASVGRSDTSDRRCGADELLLLETPNHLTVL